MHCKKFHFCWFSALQGRVREGQQQGDPGPQQLLQGDRPQRVRDHPLPQAGRRSLDHQVS